MIFQCSATGATPNPSAGEHRGFSVQVQANGSGENSRSCAFIFGGLGGRGFHSDLLILDLESMRWKTVNGAVNEGQWPTARVGNSLTRVSNEAAILFGGYKEDIKDALDDCWVLNVKKAVSKSNRGDIWTRCGWRADKRGLHAAVQEPSSCRLWLVGGSCGFSDTHQYVPTDHISQLTFSSDQTLKVLALESVVKHRDKLAPNIRELPATLLLSVNAKARRKYVIS